MYVFLFLLFFVCWKALCPMAATTYASAKRAHMPSPHTKRTKRPHKRLSKRPRIRATTSDSPTENQAEA